MTEKSARDKIDEYRERSTTNSAGMSEAPGIAFCTLYMDGVPVNLTARSMTPYDALASLKISINLATEFLGVTRIKDIPQAPPPHAVDKAFPPPVDPNEPVYENVTPETEITHATSIKILPQPDNKVSLEFYEDGKQYPVIKVNKWKIEQAQKLLESVTSQDVSKAAEVKVNCAVTWTPGNEFNINGKTGRYKNVRSVELQ